MVDVNKIKSISQKPIGGAVLEMLGKRQRNREDTAVRQVVRSLRESGREVSKESIVEVFRELQQAGVGQLVYGRHGNLNRFIWEAPLKEVASMATQPTQPMGTIASLTVSNGKISIQVPATASDQVLLKVINTLKAS